MFTLDCMVEPLVLMMASGMDFANDKNVQIRNKIFTLVDKIADSKGEPNTSNIDPLGQITIKA